MMKNFWRMLRTYCLQSTIVGLKYFYLYPDIVSRCFWAVNMVAVLSMSFLLTILLYNRFAEMPTRVTIESQFEPVEDLPYPAIALCTPNQMTISSLKYFSRGLVDGNVTIDLENALPVILGFTEVMNGLNPDQLQHLQNLLDLNRYTITEVMGTMPQSCNRFLKRCFLEGKLYQDCSELFKPILTNHGYCCAFNSPYVFNGKRNTLIPHFTNRTVNAVGFTNALTVVTDYDLEDAIPGTLLNAGAILVMYTDSTEFPSDDEMAIIDTKGESYHILHATYTYCSDEVQSLPLWSRKCYFEDEHQLPFFGKYHNSDCDHMCYVTAVFKACRCFLSFLPNVRAVSACKITSIPCIINVKTNLGGVFGLLMGCSWISVLEIFFYIYLGIKNYVRSRLEKWMRYTFRGN